MEARSTWQLCAGIRFHYFMSCMTWLLTYLSLSFLSYKTGILVPTPQSGCEE